MGEATKSHKSWDFVARSFLAGGTAGCCAKSCVAPLDRVKILLQGHNKHYHHMGIWEALRGIKKKEGVQSLFKGNTIQMVRVFPYAAIQFGSYEEYKRRLQVITEHHHPHIVHLCAGSLAGLTAVAFTYPLDVMRARMAFQVSGEHIYFGLVDTFQTILAEEGFLTFYRGMVPSLLGMAPYAGLAFYTFETLKDFCLRRYPTELARPCPKNTGGLVLIIPAKLLCGSLSGAVAQSLVYPLDVARRKIQLASMLPEPDKYHRQKWWRILHIVYKDHGVKRGLFRGLTINYVRAVPMTAVSFATYETLKQQLGLDTGVSR